MLAAARHDFPQYYRTASAKDTGLMDGLVMARAAIATGLNTPRVGLPSNLRSALEKACDHTEQVFTDLREKVRRSQTFGTLGIGEQLQIERTLFDVPDEWFQ